MLELSGAYLRRAMVRPARDRLAGAVEVDESYVGGEEPGAKGRYTKRKAIVAIAVEVEGEHMGRIRLQRIPNVQAKTLTASCARPASRDA